MARRSKRPDSQREGGPGASQKGASQRPLEMLRDSEGAVILGWVGEGVFYTRFVGMLSAELGEMVASHLNKVVVAEATSLRYFSDASALKTYDLLARSAITRVVLAHRRRFADIVILTWAEGINAPERVFADAIGDPIHVITDAADFEKRLVRAAPLAKQTLDPKTWTVTVASRD
jgi:hypothetical protein